MANKGEQFPEQSQLQAGKHKVVGETHPSKAGGDVLFQAMNNQGMQGNQKMYCHQLPTGSASNPDSAQRGQPGRWMQPKHFCQQDIG